MRSKYQFWLSFNNGEQRLQLPVNPSRLKMPRNFANESIDVLGLGEITVIQDPQAKTFSFSSQFPAVYGPYCEYEDIPSPERAVEIIDDWIQSGKPIRFIVTNTNINFAVSIETFTPEEKAGDVGTIYYDLELKEYKFIQIRQIEVKSGTINIGAKASQRPDEREKPKNYVVKPGDSLWKIAKAQLGDGSQYKTVAAANRIKPNYVIHPGQMLVL